MSRRRSTRLQSAMDASFQIPLAVNTTANNLLLEDDALEHDFFGGLDYTLSTPMPTRASSSKLLLHDLQLQQEGLKPRHPEPRNFDCDYDYAQEEQEVEMGNADMNQDTPRRKRVYDSVDRELTPTPRAHKPVHGLGRSDAASPSPTPISRSPVLNEDLLTKLHEDDIRSAAVHDLPRRSLSPSATPKPKKKPTASSRALPSVHSTPVGATASSLTSRPDKGQIRAGSREPEAYMSHHEHAPSARNHSAFLSESESDVGVHLDQAAPAPVGELSRDPRLPERRLSKPPESSRARRPSTSLRRRPGSRTRSTTPLSLSRAGHDAVMLPIQEDDEDLQDRGERSPISKPQQSSGPSAPREKTMAMTKDREAQEDKEKKKEKATESAASSSSTAGTSMSKPKTALSPKAAAKRRGDILASQPAPKKRKTDVSAAPSGSKPTEGGSSRALPVRPNLADLVPASASPVTAEMPVEKKRADVELEKATPSAKPVAPETNFRPSSPSPPQYPLIEPPSELPSGDFNMRLARQERNEGSDEVQDFLSRYAKKYGPGADTTASTLPIIPKVPFPAASTQNNSHPQVPAPPKRCDVVSEVDAPKGNRVQANARPPAANPDLKGKFKSKNSVPKKGVRQVPPDKVKVSKARSASGAETSDGGASEKTASRTELTLDDMMVVPQLPSTMAVGAPSTVPQSRLISPVSQEIEVFPVADQMTIDVPPEQTSNAKSNIAASCFMSTGTYDAEEGPRAFEGPVPASCPSAPSVMPEPLAASSEPQRFKAASTVEKKREKQIGHRDRRPAEGPPPKKPSVSSAPQAPKRKTSVEPRTDDMFARKKRDNYLQKGLDLTAHSSRRYAEKPEPATKTEREVYRAPPQEAARQICLKPTATKSPASTAKIIDSGFDAAAAADVAVPSRSTTSVSDLAAGNKDQKDRAGAPSDLECKDRSDSKTHRASRKDASSKGHGKEAVKPNFQIRGDNSQKTKATLSESSRGRAGRQSESAMEDAGNTSTGSIGNVLAERLVSFSQRIMGSFGLLSSHPQTDVAERSSKAEEASEYTSHLPDLEHERQVSTEARGPDPQWRTSILSLSEPSPRKIGQRRFDDDCDGLPIGSDSTDPIGPERRHHSGWLKADESESHNNASYPGPRDPLSNKHPPPEFPADASQPLRESRKRPAGGEPQKAAEGNTIADNDFELLASERSRKRTRLSRDENVLAAGSAVSSNPSRSGKPRGMIASSRMQAAGAKNGTRGLLASSKAKVAKAGARRSAAKLNAEASASNKPPVHPDGAEGSGQPKNSCSLTLPIAPAFTGNVLRQQRMLAKSEREREKVDKEKVKFSNSDGTISGNGASTRAPLSNKQPIHEPSKSTVSHTFRFETDTRRGRRQEFEAKLKTWEQRTSAGSGSNNQGVSRKPLPDFNGLHAAQEAGLADMAARRRELVVPTIPVSPHFVVDIRLAEREKFEEARRAREKEAERMMEEKRRAREEEEEREWREARKRTVPRANAVPEWYAEVPRRTAQSR